MSALVVEQAPRLASLVFAAYCLFVLVTRWRFTRVLTQDKRFLFMFMALHCLNSVLSAVLKIHAHVQLDYSSWVSLLVQALLAAYLHYSIPRSFRHVHRRFRRRSPTP